MAQKMDKQMFLDKIFDFEKNTEWQFNGERPAVIDFYADWCGPCKMLAPVIDKLSEEYAGEVDFYKIDTQQEIELAGAFGIQSIPSLLFIPADGKPQMAQGALPEAALREVVDKELLKKPE